jgi:hypothetical protein
MLSIVIIIPLLWGKIKHDVQQGSILGPLHFIVYVTDLPNIINNKSKTVLFTVLHQYNYW